MNMVKTTQENQVKSIHRLNDSKESVDFISKQLHINKTEKKRKIMKD